VIGAFCFILGAATALRATPVRVLEPNLPAIIVDHLENATAV